MNLFLSRYFGAIFCCGFAVALIFPIFGHIPPETMIWALAAQIFCACFRIEPTDSKEVPLEVTLLYYLARFILLPIVVYLLMAEFSKVYAWALLLFLLMPPASAGPAFAALFKANVPLALLLTAAGSLLAPFVVPVVFRVIAGQDLRLDQMAMFQTMALLIFLPVVLHLPIRRVASVSCWIRENNPLIVVPLSTYTGLVAIASRREFLLENWSVAIPLMFVSAVMYLGLFSLTWRALPGVAPRSRLSFALSGSLHNITLGVVLALLHFQNEVVMFMLAANLGWVLGIIPMQYWISRPRS